MSWIENLLIVAGASLDIFASMECQGSLVSKVNKRQLLGICVLIAVCQLVAMYVGYFLAELVCRKNPVSDEAILGEILSVIIFLGLGIRLIIKAIRNERIEEHLQQKLDIKRMLVVTLMTGFNTILAGIAFGFLNTGLVAILIMVVILTILSFVAGVYTGYLFGFEQKTKVYVMGAILLWMACIDVVVRLINNLV